MFVTEKLVVLGHLGKATFVVLEKASDFKLVMVAVGSSIPTGSNLLVD